MELQLHIISFAKHNLVGRIIVFHEPGMVIKGWAFTPCLPCNQRGAYFAFPIQQVFNAHDAAFVVYANSGLHHVRACINNNVVCATPAYHL